MHQSPPSSSSSAAGSPTHVTPPLGVGGGVGHLAGAPGIMPHQLGIPGAPGMPLGPHPHPLLLAQAQAAAAAAASGKRESEIENQMLELMVESIFFVDLPKKLLHDFKGIFLL